MNIVKSRPALSPQKLYGRQLILSLSAKLYRPSIHPIPIHHEKIVTGPVESNDGNPFPSKHVLNQTTHKQKTRNSQPPHLTDLDLQPQSKSHLFSFHCFFFFVVYFIINQPLLTFINAHLGHEGKRIALLVYVPKVSPQIWLVLIHCSSPKWLNTSSVAPSSSAAVASHSLCGVFNILHASTDIFPRSYIINAHVHPYLLYRVLLDRSWFYPLSLHRIQHPQQILILFRSQISFPDDNFLFKDRQRERGATSDLIQRRRGTRKSQRRRRRLF